MGLFGHGDDPFWTDPLYDDETFAAPHTKGRKHKRGKAENDCAGTDVETDAEMSDDPVGDLIDVLKTHRKP